MLNRSDSTSGYYLAIEPQSYREGDSIKSVLVLLSGFSQQAESIFPETKLPNVAYANNMLTVCFAAGYKVCLDSATRNNMDAMLRDVVRRYKVDPANFVFGGFSAGGNIALRYVELSKQYPARSPVNPKGVFMVDAPLDVFVIWQSMELTIEAHFSDAAVQEAEEALYRMKKQFGVPKEHTAVYAKLTPFSMDEQYGHNENYLKNTAVRTYHDVDIAWRLINRRQSVHNSNYEVAAELINRLLILGNDKAEFIQSQRKGYRSNGMRHPHSWSIVDEDECIQWIKSLYKN